MALLAVAPGGGAGRGGCRTGPGGRRSGWRVSVERSSHGPLGRESSETRKKWPLDPTEAESGSQPKTTSASGTRVRDTTSGDGQVVDGVRWGEAGRPGRWRAAALERRGQPAKHARGPLPICLPA